jgi:hypothetical protein
MFALNHTQVCHSPHLLLEHPQLLINEARHVLRVVAGVPAWHQQLQRFTPAQLADCLCRTAPTHARLLYLARTQQVRRCVCVQEACCRHSLETQSTCCVT